MAKEKDKKKPKDQASIHPEANSEKPQDAKQAAPKPEAKPEEPKKSYVLDQGKIEGDLKNHSKFSKFKGENK